MQSTPETRALAQRVFDYIHAHPERHVQAGWSGYASECGTTMCIAGTAAFLVDGKHYKAYTAVPERAAELLGLSDKEANAVFFEMNEERSLQLFKKVVVGEEFSEEELEQTGSSHSPARQNYPDWTQESNFRDMETLQREVEELNSL